MTLRLRTKESTLKAPAHKDEPGGRRQIDTPAWPQGSETLPVGTRVDVHARYDLGRWVRGFSVAEVRPDGYRIRRTSDGAVLSQTIRADELRVASPVPSRRVEDQILEQLLRGDRRSSTNSMKGAHQ